MLRVVVGKGTSRSSLSLSGGDPCEGGKPPRSESMPVPKKKSILKRDALSHEETETLLSAQESPAREPRPPNGEHLVVGEPMYKLAPPASSAPHHHPHQPASPILAPPPGPGPRPLIAIRRPKHHSQPLKFVDFNEHIPSPASISPGTAGVDPPHSPSPGAKPVYSLDNQAPWNNREDSRLRPFTDNNQNTDDHLLDTSERDGGEKTRESNGPSPEMESSRLGSLINSMDNALNDAKIAFIDEMEFE